MLGALIAPPRGARWDYLVVVALTAAVTAVGWFLPLSYLALGYLYLLAVIAVSTRVRRLPALSAAVLGSLAWNFFFVPPRLSFSVMRFDESLLLITYFVVALICSQLTALRAAADRANLLAASERMHQSLFGNVAHELKTPISVFRSAVEQLETGDPEKRARLMSEIRIAVYRLERLVANLLSQTRLESGVLTPRFDWCHARDLVAAARRSIGRRLDKRPLTVEIPLEFPIFRADAALMEEAIAHLLTNAAVHTPPEAAIRVSAALGRNATRVSIMVTDDGPGMPPEMGERMFGKFTRGRGAKAGGLGLGLSIVRGFMAAQGGDVSYIPGATRGSQFILSLPYQPYHGIPTT